MPAWVDDPRRSRWPNLPVGLRFCVGMIVRHKLKSPDFFLLRQGPLIRTRTGSCSRTTSPGAPCYFRAQRRNKIAAFGSTDCVVAHLSISMTEHHHHRRSRSNRTIGVWRRLDPRIPRSAIDLSDSFGQFERAAFGLSFLTLLLTGAPNRGAWSRTACATYDGARWP